MLVNRGQLFTLNAPQMIVLNGGMRVLGTNIGGRANWCIDPNAGQAHKRLFMNLFDMNTVFQAKGSNPNAFEGKGLDHYDLRLA